jgi:hypothetical protein
VPGPQAAVRGMRTESRLLRQGQDGVGGWARGSLPPENRCGPGTSGGISPEITRKFLHRGTYTLQNVHWACRPAAPLRLDDFTAGWPSPLSDIAVYRPAVGQSSVLAPGFFPCIHAAPGVPARS